MKPSVYIETSVISYYTVRPSRDLIMAGHQQLTHEWWEKYRSQFDVTISMLVLEEIKGGDPNAAKKRPEAVNEMPILEITEPAEYLASVLVESKAVPLKCAEEALHIALATVNSINFY